MRTLACLVAIAATSLTLAACGGGTTDPHKGEQVITGPQISSALPPWKPNYVQLARRARLLGIPDSGSEKFHIHEQLRIYREGILEPIAELIGVDVKHKVLVGLHTHVAEGQYGAPGVIHMEADRPFTAALGDFFAIWGVKFGGGWLGGLHASGDTKLRTFVNGREIKDPAAHVLKKDDNIVIAYGKTNDFDRLPDTTPLKNANSGKGGCSIGTSKHPAKSCRLELTGKKP